MANELAGKAKEAIFEDGFKLAIDLYSKAIDLDPANPVFFADRAQANIEVNNFTEAVADANKAIELNPSMAKAYLRKGTACMKLEEYHTAKTALVKSASLAQDDSRFTKLITECDQRIAEESNDLSKSATPIVQSSSAPVSVVSPQMDTIPSTKPKYRHEYYQKPEEVVVTIFAKGIPAEHVTVNFGEQILSVTIDVPGGGGDAYRFQPLSFGKIVPDKSRYQVLSIKIEIRLAKAEVINWASLEYSKEITVAQKTSMPTSVCSWAQRPSYPSSKSRTKDWDRLEAEVKKEEEDEKLDGDAALNKLFRDIYRNADEDMRRAMTKSFVA